MRNLYLGGREGAEAVTLGDGEHVAALVQRVAVVALDPAKGDRQGWERGESAAFDRMAALRPSANVYARISYDRELTGDRHGALEAMELAVDSTGVGEPAAWTRTLTGNLLLSLRRTAEANVRFREALAFETRYPGALSGLGTFGRRTAFSRALVPSTRARHRRRP